MSARRIVLLGAGNLGTGLGLALRARGAPVTAVWSRSAGRRDAAAQALGALPAPTLTAALDARPDLLLVCVSDAALPEVAQAASGHPALSPSVTALHTSGLLPASVLSPLRPARLGSLHPLIAAASPTLAAQRLDGAWYGLEGDEEARAVAAQLVAALGGRALELAAEDKARYHAGAVMAANLLVALLDHAVSLMGGKEAREACVALASSALANVAALGSAEALTGPLVRGDVDTVRAHLAALPDTALPAYVALSRTALALARERGLPESTAQLLEAALATSSAG